MEINNKTINVVLVILLILSFLFGGWLLVRNKSNKNEASKTKSVLMAEKEMLNKELSDMATDKRKTLDLNRDLNNRINELLKVFLRKTVSDEPIEEAVIQIDDLIINTSRKSVTRAGIPIDLTAKEYLLLEYLAKNKGIVISRVDIAEKIWDVKFDTGTNYIDVYINYLRKKIDKDYLNKLIHTKVGLGYVLKDQSD